MSQNGELDDRSLHCHDTIQRFVESDSYIFRNRKSRAKQSIRPMLVYHNCHFVNIGFALVFQAERHKVHLYPIPKGAFRVTIAQKCTAYSPQLSLCQQRLCFDVSRCPCLHIVISARGNDRLTLSAAPYPFFLAHSSFAFMASDDDERLYAYRRFGSEPLGVGCFGKTYKCLHIAVTNVQSVDAIFR